jgi:hypothetical protein
MVEERIASFSADGKTTDFTINHNFPYTPTKFSVTPMSKDSAEAFYIYEKQ